MLENVDKIFFKNKIRLAIGKDFFPVPVKNKYFRLAIASLDEEEIVEGIERLLKAVREIYK